MLLLSGTLLAVSPSGIAPGSPDPGPNDLTLTSSTIWSYYTETPPSMADPDDSVWFYPQEVLGLVPGHVALSGGTSLEIRSIYTDTDVYFRIAWRDVVENSGVPKWVYHNGNWTFTSPWEDGIGLYFPISDPQGHFLEDGCMRTCHITDWENPQNQERKFTLTEEETGDMWFWSAGLTGPWDFAMDTYVTDTPSTNNVGYYEDPEMGLGLVKNRHLTEYMEYVYLSRPVYMQDPNAEPSLGGSFIAKGEEALFDETYYDPFTGQATVNPITHQPWKNGDTVAGYLINHLPDKGLGQIDARGGYDVIEQQWTLTLRRPLDTGDPVHDVIFDDLTKTYQFGISLFGDIMGGGDASEPFVEPDGGEDRCVMNKVTNTVGLRFRPVVRATKAEMGAPLTWDGQGWDEGSQNFPQELIHRSGEIHDAWDWVDLHTAWDGESFYFHLAHADPNASEEYMVELGWLTPGMVSVEETFHLLNWLDTDDHMGVAEGTADLWRWELNTTSDPDGTAMDLNVVAGKVQEDASGPDDLVARTWREGDVRHITLSRALDTGEDGDDLIFEDLARTYVLRLALYTSDRDEVLVTFPISGGFEPDPMDTTPASSLTGLSVSDGADSDLLLSWDPCPDEDFGQYRVYISEDPFDDLVDMVPIARISDVQRTDLHLRGVRPATTHHVAVLAVDDNRNLPTSVEARSVAVTDDTSPADLVDIKAFDNLDSDLLITWSPGDSPDIDRYEVYVETEAFQSASSLEPAAVVHGMRAEGHRLGGLEAGNEYHVAVVAVDWSGNADRTVASIPATPTDVTAPPEVRGLDASTPQVPESEGEVLLKWSDSTAEDVSHYNVYLSLTPIEELQNFAPWASVPMGEAWVVVDGLNPGVKYYFAVTAVDRMGHEGPSKYTVGSVASTAEPPETVRGLVAVQTGSHSARVSWEPVNVTGAPVVRYRVYVSTEPIADITSPNVTLLGNVTPGTDPSFLATDLEQGVAYHFAVLTEDALGRESTGPIAVASVSIPVVEQEGPSTWDTYGPVITSALFVVVLVLVAYVAISRQRRYGRLLRRRPSWERKNGRNGP